MLGVPVILLSSCACFSLQSSVISPRNIIIYWKKALVFSSPLTSLCTAVSFNAKCSSITELPWWFTKLPLSICTRNSEESLNIRCIGLFFSKHKKTDIHLVVWFVWSCVTELYAPCDWLHIVRRQWYLSMSAE